MNVSIKRDQKQEEVCFHEQVKSESRSTEESVKEKNQTKQKDAANHINLEETQIFYDIMVKNNRRMFIAFFSIVFLSNIAVSVIKLTGTGSEYLSFTDIALELLAILCVLGVTITIARNYAGTKLSGYTTITGIMISLSIFQFAFFGCNELFATNYIAIALSIFYFDRKITIYTLGLAIVSQTLLFLVKPALIPTGPTSNLLVRYIIYFMVGIGATTGAGSTKLLLSLTIENHEESKKNLHNLREIAKSVLASISVMKNQTGEQDRIVDEMNDISQQQAASLEEISSSLEELAANSESVSDVARALYNELSNAIKSAEELKNVNDRVQNSSTSIVSSLSKVTDYSNQSNDQISHTLNKFGTVKKKSEEMSDFVSIIHDIADQVNLLSLNASIEAARAGDSGRGFAVVADEISKLADATGRNAREIEKIIKENHTLIDESNELVKSSFNMMKVLDAAILTIKEEITEVGSLIGDIDSAILTINNLNEKIHDSSRTIENSTSEQKMATEESSQTTSDIAKKAQEIVIIATKVQESSGIMNDLAGNLEELTADIIN